VASSGGRDSSLLLAVAADLAARENLDRRPRSRSGTPGDPAVDESSWQELVVAHLRSVGLRFRWTCRDIATSWTTSGR